MKSAYELAMERLNRSAPTQPITDAQKKELAEIDSRYAARIAEREIFLTAELDKAQRTGDFEAIDPLQRQIAGERRRLVSERDEAKDAVRNRA